ncbi:MAG: hypothetical protein WBX22_13330 [Silvibacterium sp.]
MHRSLSVASALIAVLRSTSLAQQEEKPVSNPESPGRESSAPNETPTPEPIILVPERSRPGRRLFEQKRDREAKPWLEKACNLGNMDSCGLLSDLYYDGYEVAISSPNCHNCRTIDL